MPAAQSTKTERIEARIRPEQKAAIQQAADLLGVSVTDFLVESVQSRAEMVIRQYREIQLSKRDSRAFVEALLHPPAPNASLKKASDAHRALLEE